jgi:hypothetical protein
VTYDNCEHNIPVRYSTLTAFPSAITAGADALAIALDTHLLYKSNGTIWQVIADVGVHETIESENNGDSNGDGGLYEKYHREDGRIEYRKGNGTAMYPVHAYDASGLLKRCEPFLTPEQLVSRFLKGIPLIFRNGDRFTPQELKDRIYLAINESELLLGRTITKEKFKDKLPFDYNLYKSYIHLKTTAGPIVCISQLAIVSSDNNNIFEVPPTWIETSNFSKNQINVIPLLAAYGVTTASSTPVSTAGLAFLAVMDGMGWVPAYWQVRYEAGLSNKEGNVPTPVNELIGCVAAIAILSEIAATYMWTSQSQSQDGISQSSSGPGPLMFKTRIEELILKRDELIRKLKAIFSSRYFVSNI